MKKRIVGYGELLLRLTPYEYGSLIEQSDVLKIGFAGAEANIIADLALMGHKTTFITALPQNPLGRKAVQFLQGYGINTDSVIWNEGRLGTYYIEHGYSIRGSRVTYDRADSLISKIKIPYKEWEVAFSDARFFVLTGITPALSEVCRENIRIALEIAQKMEITIVFDLNYRRTLWTKEAAKRSFESILPFVNVLCANVGSAYDVFDVTTSSISDNESLKIATKEAADALGELGNFDWIAMTMRVQNNANDNALGSMIKRNNEYCYSPAIPTTIIDRLGGGDAFAASVIHGISNNWEVEQIVNFANAAFAATQTIHGDINYLTETELLHIASGSTQGHVQR